MLAVLGYCVVAALEPAVAATPALAAVGGSAAGLARSRARGNPWFHHEPLLADGDDSV